MKGRKLHDNRQDGDGDGNIIAGTAAFDGATGHLLASAISGPWINDAEI